MSSDDAAVEAPETPAELFHGYGRRARKQLGQHFLVDAQILHEIATLADIRPGEWVLEIGPGCGTLTLVLLQRGAKVEAIELDTNATSYLQERLEPHYPLEVREASALDIDLDEVLGKTEVPWKVVANLPYNIATKILFRLLEHHGGIEEMTLMFQKEVAHRIVAEVGDSDFGRLSLMVAMYADVHLAMTLPPDAFVPAPKVDSAVVQFHLHSQPRIEDEQVRKVFGRIVKAAFQSRRKTLANGLKSLGIDKGVVEEILEALELRPKIRPQRVSFENFAVLADVLIQKGEVR